MTRAAWLPAVVVVLLGAEILVASPTRADDMQARMQSLLDGVRTDYGSRRAVGRSQPPRKRRPWTQLSRSTSAPLQDVTPATGAA